MQITIMSCLYYIIQSLYYIDIVTVWPRNALDPSGLRSSSGCWHFRHKAAQISHHRKDTATHTHTVNPSMINLDVMALDGKSIHLNIDCNKFRITMKFFRCLTQQNEYSSHLECCFFSKLSVGFPSCSFYKSQSSSFSTRESPV